jgi:hypothetical protein
MEAGTWGRQTARIAIIAGLLLGLALLAAPTSHAARKRSPCPRGEQRSSAAVLYTRDYVDDTHALVGCLRSTRRRMVLASWFAQGSSTDDPEPQSWLTGRFAAVNQAACPGDPTSTEPCTGTLRVIDLRARRTHAKVATGSPIFDFVLTPRGSVGMIHRNELITAVGDDVQVHDTEAETWSLAYATEPKRLYWTGAGEPRSTTLR